MVSGSDHLARDLGEVDLVPIEQVHGTEAGHEEHQRGEDKEQFGTMALDHVTSFRRIGSGGC